jgi:signal transduction histidine kinase
MYPWQRLSSEAVTVCAVIALAAVIGLTALATGALGGLENGSLNLRFAVRGSVPAADVVVVGIDDATFNSLGIQWPFPRRLHAEAIDRLRADGASTIVYDVQFTEPTDPRDDGALYRAVAHAGNVILATSEMDSRGHTNVLGGDANLARAHSRAAAANLVADGTGVIRRFGYAVHNLATLPVAVAQRSGHSLGPGDFAPSGALIDFRGPAGAIRTVSFATLLAGGVPPSTFTGKVVVVGATAATLGDLHPVPLGGGKPMSGPEIEANAIWTALHGNPLRQAPPWVAVLVILVIALFVPILSLRVRLQWWAPLVLGLGGGYAILAQLAFGAGVVMPIADPLLTWIVATVGSLIAGYLAASVYRSALEHEVDRRTAQLQASRQEVIRARDEALAASNMKSAFLTNISHEIRTPMNGVIGMNDLLLQTSLDEEQRAFSEQIARSSDHMMAIINDLLDISRIETGNIELTVAEFDLRDAVKNACAYVEIDATAKGLEFSLELADDLPVRLRGDVARIRQVLVNLAFNAIKFTEQGSVRVQVTRQAERIRFEVTDTGIGIEEAELDRMFDPFVQADVSLTRRYGGNGLGLAISKQLVERMGGRVGARSALGAGSTFWFELPLPVAPVGPRPPRRDGRAHTTRPRL